MRGSLGGDDSSLVVQELLSAPMSHFLADNDSFASSLIKSFHKEAFVLKLKYEPAREPWLGVRRSHVPHFTSIYTETHTCKYFGPSGEKEAIGSFSLVLEAKH